MKLKILPLIFLTVFAFCFAVGCAIPPPAPDTEITPETTLQPAPQPTPLYNIVIEKNDADLDGDGMADRITAYAEYHTSSPFYIDVYLSAADETLHVTCKLCPLDTNIKIRVVDMTGDGRPEIVFPDLGGTSTKGEIYPLVLIVNRQVKQVPVFSEKFFDGNTFFLDGSGSDMKSGSAIVHIINRASGRKYVLNLSETLQQNPPSNGGYYAQPIGDAYTIRGDIIELANGKFGLKVMTVIDIYAYTETGADDPLHLGTFYLYSTLEYTNDEWHVIDETLERYMDAH